MGIYIDFKNLLMPKSCFNCLFSNARESDYFTLICAFTGTATNYYDEERPSDCPLIDLDLDENKLRYMKDMGITSYEKAVFDLLVDKPIDIVRCGECKYLMSNGRCEQFADDMIQPSASDFCSYGERRTDEADR